MRLAELVTEIRVDTTKFDASLNNVRSKLEKIQSGFAAIGRIGRRTFLATTAGIAGTVTVFARFEQSMQNVRVLTEATEKEFQALTNQAKELGRTTVFSAKQSADAMVILAKAGFEVNQIMSAMPGLLSLAASGDLEIAEAASIAARSIKQFGLESRDVSKVADVLAKGANSANATVSDLGLAMSFAAPQAKKLGLSIEEVVSPAALLTERLGDASRAGTGLNGILLRLTGGSQAAQKFLEKYNIEVKDGRGNLRSFGSIIDDIRSKMSKLSAVEQAAEIGAAFGLRAGPALQSLLDVGGKAIDDYTDKLRDSVGFADTVAEQKLNTLIGTMTKLKSAVEGLVIEIGSAFKPEIESLANAIRDMIPKVQAWVKENKPLIATIGKVTLAVSGFAAVVGPVIATIAGFALAGGALPALAAGLSALAPVIGVVAAAFAGWKIGEWLNDALSFDGIIERWNRAIDALWRKVQEIREFIGLGDDGILTRGINAVSGAVGGTDNVQKDQLSVQEQMLSALTTIATSGMVGATVLGD